MTYARRTDGPHKAVMQTLRRLGWKVKDVSRLPKFVDLVAQKQARTVLIEVKTEDGEYTKAQQQLIADGWQIVTVRSVDDAVNL